MLYIRMDDGQYPKQVDRCRRFSMCTYQHNRSHHSSAMDGINVKTHQHCMCWANYIHWWSFLTNIQKNRRINLGDWLSCFIQVGLENVGKSFKNFLMPFFLITDSEDTLVELSHCALSECWRDLAAMRSWSEEWCDLLLTGIHEISSEPTNLIGWTSEESWTSPST